MAHDGSCTGPIAAVPSDGELVLRAQRGAVNAFAVLYDRHAGRVLALARRLLGSPVDADDLLHDVFLEAWQSVREYDPDRASVVTWLLVRTRSRAFDRLARRKREQSALHDVADADPSAAPPSAAESQLALRSALGELDAPVRNAVELMYVWGFTASEISVRTRVPEGTVRSRLARGLYRLEQALR